MRKTRIWLALTTATLLAGCAASDAHRGGGALAGKSLYERLGGQKAIAAVIDDFVNRAAGDLQVNFTRKGTSREWEATPQNVAHLKTALTEFVCMATGGPQSYHGRDMKSVHKGMMISGAEFAALAGDLRASLDRFRVPQAEQDELLKIVGSTQGQIVEK